MPQVAFGRTYAGVGAASRPPPRRQPFGRVNPSAVNNNNSLAPSAAGHAKPSCWIGSANTAPPSKQQQQQQRRKAASRPAATTEGTQQHQPQFKPSGIPIFRTDKPLPSTPPAPAPAAATKRDDNTLLSPAGSVASIETVGSAERMGSSQKQSSVADSSPTSGMMAAVEKSKNRQRDDEIMQLHSDLFDAELRVMREREAKDKAEARLVEIEALREEEEAGYLHELKLLALRAKQQHARTEQQQDVIKALQQEIEAMGHRSHQSQGGGKAVEMVEAETQTVRPKAPVLAVRAPEPPPRPPKMVEAEIQTEALPTVTVVEPLEAVAAPLLPPFHGNEGEGPSSSSSGRMPPTPQSLASSSISFLAGGGGSARRSSSASSSSRSKIPVSAARSATPRHRRSSLASQGAASDVSGLDWDSWLNQAAEKAKSPPAKSTATSPALLQSSSSSPVPPPPAAPRTPMMAPAAGFGGAPAAAPPCPVAPMPSPPPVAAPAATMRVRDESTNEEIEVDPVKLCSALMGMHREMKEKEGMMQARIEELEGMLAEVFPELRSHKTGTSGKKKGGK